MHHFERGSPIGISVLISRRILNLNLTASVYDVPFKLSVPEYFQWPASSHSLGLFL